MAEFDTYPSGAEDLDLSGEAWPYTDVVITSRLGAMVMLQEADAAADRKDWYARGQVAVFRDADAATKVAQWCWDNRHKQSPPSDGQHRYHNLIGFETNNPAPEVRQAMADPAREVLIQRFKFREQEYRYSELVQRTLSGLTN